MSAPAGADPALAAAADELAGQLATPELVPPDPSWWAQSLTIGAVGVALLHIERAHLGAGSWATAHSWVRAAAATGTSAADHVGLHFGAPALAFALHAAHADGTTRYAAALADLDAHVDAVAHRRTTAAEDRIARRALPTFDEYDLLHGLTGIGAHLLHHRPGSDVLGRVLTYLVRLTTPLRDDGETLPGWWVAHDPSRGQSEQFRGGHANLGMAHGITGPLALLAHAARRGITVEGQQVAIETICSWLDTWQQDSATGPWWPDCVSRRELRARRTNQPGPQRPSWCYGTPGIARAHQLAGIATGDTRRRQLAEHALTGCISDPAQLHRITDSSLCHGWAGLHRTTTRIASDALSPHIAAHLPTLTDALLRSHDMASQDAVTRASTGLLDGRAGLTLALHATAHSPVSGWDMFLLIN